MLSRLESILGYDATYTRLKSVRENKLHSPDRARF